jgi:hypothetical protein
MKNDLYSYVDLDDTIVRSVGAKRIPIPKVIQHVRDLQNKELFYSVGARAAESRPSDRLKNLASQIVLRLFYPSQI